MKTLYEKISSMCKKTQGEQNALAKVYAEFSERRGRETQTCANCTPGREGTKQMMRILNKACGLNAKAEDIATLEELAELVEKTSRCKLCRKHVSSLMSTLHDFRLDTVSNEQ